MLLKACGQSVDKNGKRKTIIMIFAIISPSILLFSTLINVLFKYEEESFYNVMDFVNNNYIVSRSYRRKNF